jgi:hypothetical protein
MRGITAVRNPGRRALQRRLLRCREVDESSRVDTRPKAIRRVLANHPELITAGCASRMCRVGPIMVGRWIDSGLWALPRLVRHHVYFYRRADVECWIRTGGWPGDSLFRAQPGN